MLFQPSNVSPDEVNGTGCIDVTSNLEIAWQVNGNSAMTKYQVTIYKNDAASTFVYSTGVQTLSVPFWGTNYKGEVQYFSVVITSNTMSTAGMVNGQEYKIVITQFSAGNDTGYRYTASSTVAAGNYYMSIGSGRYASFTLTSSLPSGATISYSSNHNIMCISSGGVFTTTTANVGTSHTGTQLSSSAYTGGEDFIVQSTASVFLTRNAPTVTINEFPTPMPYRAYSFTATYTQAQGDALNWMRWELAETGSEDEPLVDTGKIIGTGQLQVDYDGLFTGKYYSVRCTVETTRGVEATSGWVEFYVYYVVSGTPGLLSVCQPINRACLLLNWDDVSGSTGYAIYRREGSMGILKYVTTLPYGAVSMWDYGVKSGSTYTYYLFPESNDAYSHEPMVSEPITYSFWAWAIIESAMGDDNAYHILSAYAFKFGNGGVTASSVTNNNTPQLNRTFTPYPNRQPDSANYMSGQVGGLINFKANANAPYADTASQADAIMALSVSPNDIFLKDPKGNFRRIHTSQPITKEYGIKKQELPTTIVFPWVEVGSTDGVSLVSVPGDKFYLSDMVIETTIHIEPDTGSLIWTIPDKYEDGSILSLALDGALIQSFDWTFTPADMRLYQSTGEVTASV